MERVNARIKSIAIIRKNAHSQSILSNRKISKMKNKILDTANELRKSWLEIDNQLFKRYTSLHTKAGHKRILTDEEGN